MITAASAFILNVPAITTTVSSPICSLYLSLRSVILAPLDRVVISRRVLPSTSVYPRLLIPISLETKVLGMSNLTVSDTFLKPVNSCMALTISLSPACTTLSPPDKV